MRLAAAALIVAVAPFARAQSAACLNPAFDATCATAMRQQIAARRRGEDLAGADAVAQRTTLYRALRELRDFRFEPGDVVLLRSDEALSAAISQIGMQPAFFSHMAIVGLDARWDSLEVVEAGVDEGLRTVPLDDWLEREFVRVAVYRHHDHAVARRAAIAAYDDAGTRNRSAREYDFALALDDPARLYCSEVVMRAYAGAAPEAPPVPPLLSRIGALVDTFPLATLGVREDTVFLPDDLELDSRFARVVELRVPELLPAAAAMDDALRRLFDDLRGSRRDQALAEIDAMQASGSARLPPLMRSGLSTYFALPADARARFAGLSRWLERELATANVAAAGQY